MKQIGEKTPICFLLPDIPPSRSCGGQKRIVVSCNQTYRHAKIYLGGGIFAVFAKQNLFHSETGSEFPKN